MMKNNAYTDAEEYALDEDYRVLFGDVLVGVKPYRYVQGVIVSGGTDDTVMLTPHAAVRLLYWLQEHKERLYQGLEQREQ